MKRTIRLAIVTVVLVATWAGPALAAPVYNIDFNDVEIRKVIETVSEVTGRNFLIDDRVQGRVTVVGPKSLTANEIYQVFLSILQVKGYAVVPAGKINKIVPAANIGTYGLDTKVGPADSRRTLDRYVTQVIPVEYSSADDLKNLLQPLLPKTDSITSYAPTNLLIITTTESVLSRLAEIISVVDVAGAREEIRIIPVNFAPAEELAAKITQVLQSQNKQLAAIQRAARSKQAGQPGQAAEAKIIADQRTNSLIAIGDVQTLDRIEDLVDRLDVAIPEGTGKVHVYYLQNADATELAKVLTGIPLEQSAKIVEGTPQQQAQQAARARASKSELSIIADTATNSLVITGTPEEYAALAMVIDKLDIPRDQVLVEVLIAEVTLTKGLDLGVEWRIAGTDNEDAAGIVGTSFGDLDTTLVQFPSTPSGLVAGAVGEALTFNIGGEDITFNSFAAVIRALEADTDVNILSTPTIVTVDNKEAEIIVGQNVPYVTGQKFDANNNPIFTFEYRDVGITVRLTPQINKNRIVKLDVFAKLEALVSSTTEATDELAPTTLKRQAQTTLVVDDGNTVVLGGLIRDDEVLSKRQVPILGDIPIIGALFRSQGTVTEKTNLLIFLTPHIIASAKDMKDVSTSTFRQMPLLSRDIVDGTNLEERERVDNRDRLESEPPEELNEPMPDEGQ